MRAALVLLPRPKKLNWNAAALRPTTSITQRLHILCLCSESNKAVLSKRIKCLIVQLKLTTVYADKSPKARLGQSSDASSTSSTSSHFSWWKNCVTLEIINCEYCSLRSCRHNSWLKCDNELQDPNLKPTSKSLLFSSCKKLKCLQSNVNVGD